MLRDLIKKIDLKNYMYFNVEQQFVSLIRLALFTPNCHERTANFQHKGVGGGGGGVMTPTVGMIAFAHTVALPTSVHHFLFI